jgi:hypothetical protein
MGDVIKVVEKLFEHNRFDYNLADSDSDLPDGNDDSSTSGDESDSEAEDEDRIRSTKHSKKKKHNSRYSSNSDSEPEAPAWPAHNAPKTTSKATIPKEVSSKKQATDKHSGQDDVEQLITSPYVYIRLVLQSRICQIIQRVKKISAVLPTVSNLKQPLVTFQTMRQKLAEMRILDIEGNYRNPATLVTGDHYKLALTSS